MERKDNLRMNTMKVAVIGATGFVGKNITTELVNRGIDVTGFSRNGQSSNAPNLKYIAVNALNVEELSSALIGFDIVVSAFSAGWTNPNIYEDFIEGSKAIQSAVKRAGVKRFISIGGAGSLYLPDGTQLVDTFPTDNPFVPGAKAARDYYTILKEEVELDWAFFSPAMDMHQGITTGRTGKYRLGTDYPVIDENGKNVLSVEDLAVVIADEVEHPKHHQKRFTAAY
jgi:putative NADH-flavin reductase